MNKKVCKYYVYIYMPDPLQGRQRIKYRIIKISLTSFTFITFFLNIDSMIEIKSFHYSAP